MMFIFTEILLYIAFLTLDIFGAASVWIKYISIFICFITAMYHSIKTHEYFISIVMALTLFADTFLLLLDRYYIIGVLSFCIVQTLYAAYMISLSGKKSIIPRISLFILAVLILTITDSADLLSIAAAWSFTQLFANVLQAFLIRKLHPHGLIYAIGLLLFLMCDTCVGLNNITIYFTDFPLHRVLSGAGLLMWVFYLPSQVLITYSFCNNRRTL